MSALAELSGVPAPTIKHYMREGLLPGAEVRTSRNMAFYDPALANRIREIKRLQREQFLPLRAIKAILIDGKPSEDDDDATKAAIERALESMATHESRSRRELVASGMRESDLDFFVRLGVITPRRNAKTKGPNKADEEVFDGDDLSLLRLLQTARREGITESMLPREIIGPYVGAISELVRLELEMFRQGVVPQAAGDHAALTKLTDVATRLSEQLVVLVRRKMLVPMLQELLRESAAATAQEPKQNHRAPRPAPPVRAPSERPSGPRRRATRARVQRKNVERD